MTAFNTSWPRTSRTSAAKPLNDYKNNETRANRRWFPSVLLLVAVHTAATKLQLPVETLEQAVEPHLEWVDFLEIFMWPTACGIWCSITGGW